MAELLHRGRTAYARRAWRDAFETLSQADETAPLGAEDLVLLATAASMVGRYDVYLGALERAHHAFLAVGETGPAVRCAFWVATFSRVRGEAARATGWFGRAQRLLAREDDDSAERGYLLITAIIEHEERGDYEAAHAVAAEGIAIGERFGEPDLIALALHEQGRAPVRARRDREPA